MLQGYRCKKIRRRLGLRTKTLYTSVSLRVLNYLTWNVSTKMIRRSKLHLCVSLWNTPETEARFICKGTKVSSYWAGLLSEITAGIPVIQNVYFSAFRVASFMFLLLEVQPSLSLKCLCCDVRGSTTRWPTSEARGQHSK